MCGMPANGPAIKGVSVPAVGGVARFLESWYKDAGLYECRGTMLIESMLIIPLLLFI